MDKKTEPKVVQIKENDLVNLIENIINDAVTSKKQQWISEQEKKTKETLEETIIKVVKSNFKVKK